MKYFFCSEWMFFSKEAWGVHPHDPTDHKYNESMENTVQYNQHSSRIFGH